MKKRNRRVFWAVAGGLGLGLIAYLLLNKKSSRAGSCSPSCDPASETCYLGSCHPLGISSPGCTPFCISPNICAGSSCLPGPGGIAILDIASFYADVAGRTAVAIQCARGEMLNIELEFQELSTAFGGTWTITPTLQNDTDYWQLTPQQVVLTPGQFFVFRNWNEQIPSAATIPSGTYRLVVYYEPPTPGAVVVFDQWFVIS